MLFSTPITVNQIDPNSPDPRNPQFKTMIATGIRIFRSDGTEFQEPYPEFLQYCLNKVFNDSDQSAFSALQMLLKAGKLRMEFIPMLEPDTVNIIKKATGLSESTIIKLYTIKELHGNAELSKSLAKDIDQLVKTKAGHIDDQVVTAE